MMCRRRRKWQILQTMHEMKWGQCISGSHTLSVDKKVGDCRINNAGTNAYQYSTLSEFTESDLRQILDTNVLGVMLACREVRLLRFLR